MISNSEFKSRNNLYQIFQNSHLSQRQLFEVYIQMISNVNITNFVETINGKSDIFICYCFPGGFKPNSNFYHVCLKENLNHIM